MKTITPEIIERIFALYWGQDIAIREGNDSPDTTNFVLSEAADFYKYAEDYKLQVSPLSAITDEDKIKVAIINYKLKSDNEIKLSLCIGNRIIEAALPFLDRLPLAIAQYLYSKGYALPYGDYTVEDLVELGVYELKNNSK